MNAPLPPGICGPPLQRRRIRALVHRMARVLVASHEGERRLLKRVDALRGDALALAAAQARALIEANSATLRHELYEIFRRTAAQLKECSHGR